MNHDDYRYSVKIPPTHTCVLGMWVQAHGGEKVALTDVIKLLVTLPEPVLTPRPPGRVLKAKLFEIQREDKHIQQEWGRTVDQERARVFHIARDIGWGEPFDISSLFWKAGYGPACDLSLWVPVAELKAFFKEHAPSALVDAFDFSELARLVKDGWLARIRESAAILEKNFSEHKRKLDDLLATAAAAEIGEERPCKIQKKE